MAHTITRISEINALGPLAIPAGLGDLALPTKYGAGFAEIKPNCRRQSMRTRLLLLALLAGLPAAHAADIEAGKARASAVCAACHGGNGVSVAAGIPNLAGQKVGYLTDQLQAFKAGERKSDLMNAIASQLEDQDMENVATFFASLPGAADSTAKSELLPNIAKSRIGFPADYKTRFTRYLTMNFPDDKQVRFFYASPVAIKAAATGAPLPAGSMIVVEVFNAKLDEKENPVKDSDGFFAPDKIVGYATMEKEAGWGAEIPEMLRNGDWNYAPFTADKIQRSGFNQAVCLACHKPLPQDNHLFTMKQLGQFAHAD
jgi:cytochrome c553